MTHTYTHDTHNTHCSHLMFPISPLFALPLHTEAAAPRLLSLLPPPAPGWRPSQSPFFAVRMGRSHAPLAGGRGRSGSGATPLQSYACRPLPRRRLRRQRERPREEALLSLQHGARAEGERKADEGQREREIGRKQTELLFPSLSLSLSHHQQSMPKLNSSCIDSAVASASAPLDLVRRLALGE